MRSPVWAGDWPITQPWGYTTLNVEPILPGTGTHWHCGVDVGMPIGTELRAARAGVVVRTGFGLLAIQSGRETHYYVHIDRAVVGMGSAVATGQLIAYSGNKLPQGGYSTGAHLHFERNAAGLNTPPGVDPMPLLQLPVYSSGGGQLEAPDMTPEEHVWLEAAYKFVSNPLYAHFHEPFVAIDLQLKALTAAVAGLKGAAGSSDSGAWAAAVATIQELLAGLSEDLAGARTVIDKIDRGE